MQDFIDVTELKYSEVVFKLLMAVLHNILMINNNKKKLIESESVILKRIFRVGTRIEINYYLHLALTCTTHSVLGGCSKTYQKIKLLNNFIIQLIFSKREIKYSR